MHNVIFIYLIFLKSLLLFFYCLYCLLYLLNFTMSFFFILNVVAVKVAGKMQKAVTEKRGEIDSLQSKLRWLEECLEAALKVLQRRKYYGE